MAFSWWLMRLDIFAYIYWLLISVFIKCFLKSFSNLYRYLLLIDLYVIFVFEIFYCLYIFKHISSYVACSFTLITLSTNKHRSYLKITFSVPAWEHFHLRTAMLNRSTIPNSWDVKTAWMSISEKNRENVVCVPSKILFSL